MRNRRKFILQTVVAGSALTLGAAGWTIADEKPTRALSNLRILILGGTGFIGPHFVRAAVEKGHRVSIFSRGTSQAELPAGIERLVGDRNGDLESIKNRDWDAVIDLATYGPAWVRSLGEALIGRVKHYTFVSTDAVYDSPGANRITTEDSRLKEYTWSEDPYTITSNKEFKSLDQYGAMKLLCEREAEKQFAGRTLILRPGLIFGPGGLSLCLFWMDRMARGGHMLASGDPSMPVQFVDVRDMAEWVIRMIEKNGIGTYNVMGPKNPITFADMIGVMTALVATTPKVTWVPHAWLAARNDGGIWEHLIFWATTVREYMRMSAQRAFAEGLTQRPMDVTLNDSFNWHRKQSAEEQARVFLGAKKEDGTGMTWSVYLAREKRVLAAWNAEESKRNKISEVE